MKKFILAISFLGSAGICYADVLFSDGTFNLANYSQTIFNLNPSAASITVTQCASCGNPGSALDLNYNINAGAGTNVVTITGEINKSWTYDPSTQGAILGLDFSVDKFVHTPAVNSVNTGIPLLLQNGNYYLDFVFGPTPKDQFNSISASNLQAGDFSLIDFSNGAINGTSHPDFTSAGGPIGLGTAVRFQGLPFIGSFTSEVRLDNLNMSIVPEPNSAALVLILLCVFGPFALLRHGRRQPNSLMRPTRR
jgi:hypothetical protein